MKGIVDAPRFGQRRRDAVCINGHGNVRSRDLETPEDARRHDANDRDAGRPDPRAALFFRRPGGEEARIRIDLFELGTELVRVGSVEQPARDGRDPLLSPAGEQAADVGAHGEGISRRNFSVSHVVLPPDCAAVSRQCTPGGSWARLMAMGQLAVTGF